MKQTDLIAWPWVYPSYTLSIAKKIYDIQSLEIDPGLRMADINREDNKLVPAEIKPHQEPKHK